MTEPNHFTDDTPTVHPFDPAALDANDNPLALNSRLPIGTYAFVLDAPEVTVEVGALGEHRFPAGAYVYVGNMFGTGGLRHVRHHRRVAADDHDTHHWHVSYLGSHPSVDLVRTVCVIDYDVECAIAVKLVSPPDPAPTDGFDSSDCPCDAHLAHGDLVGAVTPLIEATLRSKM